MKSSSVFSTLNLALLSTDIILFILLISAFLFFVYKKGINNIILAIFSSYISIVVATFFPFTIATINHIQPKGIIFIVSFVIVYLILWKSPVGKTLSFAKKPLWKSFTFSFLSLGSLLAALLNYITIPSQGIFFSLQTLLFKDKAIIFFWLVAPLLMLYFMQAKKVTGPRLKK